jgi:hypothetical protein
MKSEELLNKLIKRTEENRDEAKSFKKLTASQLNFKESLESWSILECIEHLVRYGNFYLPEIGIQLDKSKHPKGDIYRTGFFGNYFANTMLPKEKVNKMKTFKSMNPIKSKIDVKVLDTFIQQQEKALKLLNSAKETDINKVKTAISITSLIRLRLGDTFKVVIFHNWRHLIQARKLIK